MPLLNVVGINSLHKNFNVAHGLSLQETEEAFHWHLSCLQSLQTAHSIADPGVIISDFCRGFKKAALRVFPKTPQQLCVWHIMKNVNHHASKKWILVQSQETVAQPLATGIPATTDDLDGPGPDPPSYRPATNNEDGEDGEEEDPDEAADEVIANELTQQQDQTQVDDVERQDPGECQDFIFRVRVSP
jgi:hypothetical protein